MKKAISVLLSIIILLSLTACSDERNVIEISDYPLDNEVVTQILHSNKFELNAQISFYDDSDTSGYTYTYSIDNSDNTGNFVGEPSLYGVLQLEWGGDDGKSVKMICMHDESEFADITNTDNLKKSVLVACDAYGGIEYKEQIADDFITAIKDGALFSEVLPSWDAEYNGVYVNAEFLPAQADNTFIFREFEIYDQTRKDWYESRDERVLQMFVDMNPYMYTLEQLDHPDALTKEQVNNIISGNQWNITVSNVIDEAQTAGTERDLYELKLPDDTWVGTAGVIYNKSGKSTAFSYRIADTDIYQTDAGVEFAVKTAGALYGDVADIDGLAEKVKSALANKEFEYNQYGDPHCIIEHNGIYCSLNLGMKTPKVYEFTGLNIYNKNSLQAGIYSATKTDDWYKKIYNELFE